MPNTDNITYMLLVTLCVTALFFLAQFTILQVNPSAPLQYDAQGSILCQLDANKCLNTGNYSLTDSDPATMLAPDDPSVTQTGGNPFVDVFSNIKSWFLDKTGLGFLVNLISAPKAFLQAIGLPSTYAFALASLWYGLLIFLILAFMWGR